MAFKQKVINALVKKTVQDEKSVSQLSKSVFDYQKKLADMEVELEMYKSQMDNDASGLLNNVSQETIGDATFLDMRLKKISDPVHPSKTEKQTSKHCIIM